MPGSEIKELITQWAFEVYTKWNTHSAVVDSIATGFLNR